MNHRAQHAIHGWLLLLPAMALLALFTHWPALATFIDSFWSTPRPRRPAAFVGLDQYRAMMADPVFWQSAINNLWFALGTIPISIALALLMAVWVNDRIAQQKEGQPALTGAALADAEKARDFWQSLVKKANAD